MSLGKEWGDTSKTNKNEKFFSQQHKFKNFFIVETHFSVFLPGKISSVCFLKRKSASLTQTLEFVKSYLFIHFLYQFCSLRLGKIQENPCSSRMTAEKKSELLYWRTRSSFMRVCVCRILVSVRQRLPEDVILRKIWK